MLLGHVQDMIQRLAANRRERQPRSKKEKMLDLLGRERRRKRVIGWIVVILALGAAIYLIISYLNYSPEGFLGGGQFETDETGKLRRSITATPF